MFLPNPDITTTTIDTTLMTDIVVAQILMNNPIPTTTTHIEEMVMYSNDFCSSANCSRIYIFFIRHALFNNLIFGFKYCAFFYQFTILTHAGYDNLNPQYYETMREQFNQRGNCNKTKKSTQLEMKAPIFLFILKQLRDLEFIDSSY